MLNIAEFMSVFLDHWTKTNLDVTALARWSRMPYQQMLPRHVLGVGGFQGFLVRLFRLQFAIDHVLKRVHVFCWVLLAPGLRWQVMLQSVDFGPGDEGAQACCVPGFQLAAHGVFVASFLEGFVVCSCSSFACPGSKFS